MILSQTSHNSRSQSTSIKIGYATYSPTPKKVLSAFEQNDDYQESDRGGHHLVRDDKQIEYLNDLVENGTEGQAAWAQDQLDKRLYYYDPAGDREKMISAVDSWNDLTPSLALNIIEDPNSSDVSKVQAILYTAKNALYGLGGTARVGATGKIVEEVEGVEGMGKVDNALPNLESAKIDPRKLTEYALNPEHPVGGNKAKVFDSALGYNKSNADDLMKQIQEKLPQSEAVLGKSDQYGQRYTVDMQITGPNGNTTTVRTGWIIKPGSDAPEMTTIYVK
ncbi:MAG TPA: hypothetical protein VJ824_08695 [Bacillota bacterium]|nr:hypothetical protein [Bacillota bacterium]